MKSYLLISIDVEGDNVWSKTKIINTNNAEYIPRFQRLCEKYNLKPNNFIMSPPDI